MPRWEVWTRGLAGRFPLSGFRRLFWLVRDCHTVSLLSLAISYGTMSVTTQAFRLKALNDLAKHESNHSRPSRFLLPLVLSERTPHWLRSLHASTHCDVIALPLTAFSLQPIYLNGVVSLEKGFDNLPPAIYHVINTGQGLRRRSDLKRGVVHGLRNLGRADAFTKREGKR